MDFRTQNDDDDDDDDETVSYNPPTIRDSNFPKPILPSSSSLIPAATIGVRNGIRSSPDLSLPPEIGKGEPSSLKYRECLRNHAASHGGHILDGCGEFMPGSSEAMKCAACGCHRSFHRREGESDHLLYGNHYGGNRGGAGGRIPLLLPAAAHQKHIHCFSPAGMVAFGNSSGGTTATESSSEELGLTAAMPGNYQMPSKKRFRTKFSSEQKGRMMDFAERIGWRIQRQDEVELDAFCVEIGVSRQVFKVWMHNNKHSIRKLQEQQNPEIQQPPLNL